MLNLLYHIVNFVFTPTQQIQNLYTSQRLVVRDRSKGNNWDEFHGQSRIEYRSTGGRNIKHA